jgi:predicted molibdopterin-dependent oxidoreductase YjgC
VRSDVLLPTAVWGEQTGSTTNLEGRVLRLSRKVTPEGTTMESWRIAGELAVRLGQDFDLETIDEVQDQIAAVAPAFAGVDAQLLKRARDGVLLPFAEHADDVAFGPDTPGAGVSWEPIRPSPVVDVETSPAGPTGGSPDGGRDHVDVHAELAAAGDAPPTPPEPPVALHTWSGTAAAPAAVPVDAYSLRLVVGRTLYGSETVVAASPALARLAPDGALLVSPRDRDRIGVADGDTVRVTSPRGSLELPVLGDPSTPLGVAFLAINRSGPGAADLVDVTATVTDLRVETLA